MSLCSTLVTAALLLSVKSAVARGHVGHEAHLVEDGHECTADEKISELVKIDPHYGFELERNKGEMKEFLNEFRAAKRANGKGSGKGKNDGDRRRLQAASGDTYMIAVHFHVMWHEDTPYENLPLAQLESQIRVFNEDFTAQNADKSSVQFQPFVDRIGNASILFELAGVTRVMIPAVYDTTVDENIKQYDPSLGRVGSPAVEPDTRLQFWIVSGHGYAGYAYYPCPSQWRDGVVVAPNYVGSWVDDDGSFYINSQGSGYGVGRTPTHEVGHWMSLPHTFNGGCSADIYNGGDGISDTPPVASSSSNRGWNFCPAPNSNDQSANSCPETDPLVGYDLRDNMENHMDYTAHVCRVMFTEEQIAAMRFALTTRYCRVNKYRIVTSSTNSPTGAPVMLPTKLPTESPVPAPTTATFAPTQVTSSPTSQTSSPTSVTASPSVPVPQTSSPTEKVITSPPTSGTVSPTAMTASPTASTRAPSAGPIPSPTVATSSPSLSPSSYTPKCGNGVCEISEDCETCPSDCKGQLSGKPSNRFCCADGACSGKVCPSDCNVGPPAGTPSPTVNNGGAGTNPPTPNKGGCVASGAACQTHGDCCGGKCKGRICA